MPYIHSKYSVISPGTSQVSSLSTGNIVIPSVVDTLVLLQVTKPGTSVLAATFNTSENFTFLAGIQHSSGVRVDIGVLRRPTPTTAAIVTGVSSSWAGMIVLAMANTVPSLIQGTGYTGIAGGVGTSTTISNSPISVSTDLVIDVLGYGNYATVGAASVGAGQTQQFGLQINSGGGANMLGFYVSTEVASGSSTTMSWTTSVNAEFAHEAIAFKDAKFDAVGQGRITHAP